MQISSEIPRLAVKVQYNARYICLIASIAALGGLLFGYDWVVIGGAKPFYEPYFHLTSESLIGWANSCALLGCLLGSIASGLLSDHFGRKTMLILSGFLFGVSSWYTGWAQSFSTFVTWRILAGVAIGIASNVSPTYIAEISPAAWRGRLVTLNQLAVVVGILAAQIANWQIAQPVPFGATPAAIQASWNGQYGWRWMFIIMIVPSIVLFFSAWLVPESPRWLLKMGDKDAAERILTRIGGDTYSGEAVAEIGAALAHEGASSVGLREIMAPAMLATLSIGVGLAVIQQWSGINVMFSYAEEVYRSGGYGVSGVLFNIIITGAINLTFTLLALRWVDRVGRRTLMLFGCAGIALSHTALGIAYAVGIKGLPVLLLTLCTIACFAVSLGPVTWVLIAEIYPNRIRGLAVSISVSALWSACFIATFTFPILNRSLGSAGTFWIYGAICIVGFLFILRRVPETRGLSLEQIELHLNERQSIKVRYS